MRGSGGDYAAVLAVGLPQGGAFSKLLFTGKPLGMVATSIQRPPCHSACVRNDAAAAMRYSQSLVGVNPVSAARALRTGRLRTDQEAAADVSGWGGRGGAAITFFGRWTTLSIALAPLNGVSSQVVGQVGHGTYLAASPDTARHYALAVNTGRVLPALERASAMRAHCLVDVPEQYRWQLTENRSQNSPFPRRFGGAEGDTPSSTQLCHSGACDGMQSGWRYPQPTWRSRRT